MSGDVATVSKVEVRAMNLKGQRDVDLLLWTAVQKGQALLVKLAGCLFSHSTRMPTFWLSTLSPHPSFITHRLPQSSLQGREFGACYDMDEP